MSDPHRIPGPRFFIRYAELEMLPLDRGDRVSLLHEEMGLAYRNLTKCCRLGHTIRRRRTERERPLAPGEPDR